MYNADGCPGDCVCTYIALVHSSPKSALTPFNLPAYVNNNPSSFTNAYFEFAWVKVYQ